MHFDATESDWLRFVWHRQYGRSPNGRFLRHRPKRSERCLNYGKLYQSQRPLPKCEGVPEGPLRKNHVVRRALRVDVNHVFVRVWALWIDRDAEGCAAIRHSAKDIIGQALIESPRFIAAIVANIKFSFGAAIPQITRAVGQRIHGIKEANNVWFGFSVIVILAHEVEQAVIAGVNVDGKIARLEFGCQ